MLLCCFLCFYVNLLFNIVLTICIYVNLLLYILYGVFVRIWAFDPGILIRADFGYPLARQAFFTGSSNERLSGSHIVNRHVHML